MGILLSCVCFPELSSHLFDVVFLCDRLFRLCLIQPAIDLFWTLRLFNTFRLDWVRVCVLDIQERDLGCPQSALRVSRVRRPSCIRNLPFQKKRPSPRKGRSISRYHQSSLWSMQRTLSHNARSREPLDLLRGSTHGHVRCLPDAMFHHTMALFGLSDRYFFRSSIWWFVF